MVLSYDRPLFTQRWVNRLSVIPQNAMNATIYLYDPKTDNAIYDPDTGEYTSVPSALYSGPARVQPLRSARSTQETTVQSVLVSIPISAGLGFDLRPWHRAEVLSCSLNPLLVGYTYVVQEVMDSSNPVERTFLFTVNQEAQNG